MLDFRSDQIYSGCGSLPRSWILGGKKTDPGKYIWMAAIMDSGHGYLPWCGGSLVSDQFIVTAAHCFDYGYQLANLSVKLGAHTFKSRANYRESSGSEHRVVQVIRHPAYDSLSKQNDIALVKLQEPIGKFTRNLLPICLPAARQLSHQKLEGQLARVLGWGLTKDPVDKTAKQSDVLLEVDIQVWNNTDCRSEIEAFTDEIAIRPSMMCAGGHPMGNRDACQHDSGGPLMTVYNDHVVLSGIVMAGVGCGLPRMPGIYTRVSYHLDWLRETVMAASDSKLVKSSTILLVASVQSNSRPETTDDDQIGDDMDEFRSHQLYAECGRVLKLRILGGKSTEPGKNPWMAAIMDRVQHGYLPWCGGSLVSDQFIVTAAHCFDYGYKLANLSVKLGAHTFKSEANYRESGCSDHRVGQVILHPDYDSLSKQNDIALVKLQEPIGKFTRNLLPICLPAARQLSHQKLEGQLARVLGWGLTKDPVDKTAKQSDVLLEVDIQVWNNTDCRSEIEAFTDEIAIRPSMMCAGGHPMGNRDACQHDSGGPLMTVYHKHMVLSGIVMAGIGCGLPRMPGVYTSVSYHLDWLRETVMAASDSKLILNDN
ncbi:transmembrane protease serine 9-like [Oppia nitens]|uniref:transmembrane protease serine 9-like n=1 Tax=Oppia nitens TaxID=1686743 RepID=UPI0023D9A34F|nr:transmembrane protease serine 9-like [Oppia nitens]